MVLTVNAMPGYWIYQQMHSWKYVCVLGWPMSRLHALNEEKLFHWNKNIDKWLSSYLTICVQAMCWVLSCTYIGRILNTFTISISRNDRYWKYMIVVFFNQIDPCKRKCWHDSWQNHLQYLFFIVDLQRICCTFCKTLIHSSHNDLFNVDSSWLYISCSCYIVGIPLLMNSQGPVSISEKTSFRKIS